MRQKPSPISAYTSALGTRPPLHTVVGLYDLAIVHTIRAADASHRRDPEQQFNEALKAAQILNGLSCCLDMKRGGDVAVSLRDMYQTVVAVLMRAVAKRDAAQTYLQLAEAVRLTRNAWAEIAKLPLSVKPLTITPLEPETASAVSGFTSQKQSVMNLKGQGRLGLSQNDWTLERLERPSNATSGLSGKTPEIRRKSVDLA
ncbi:MAG TPA: flagellar export chaperone FliS [Terriglobia bacterium]|nr:flagellar export chaperone FliS [Terriglobia bacterium]